MIVGFYSYKGGVGRTIAMLNTAVLMAQDGKNIGLIDLDLEAASVHQILGIDLKKDDKSLIDILLGGDILFLNKLVVPLNGIIQNKYNLQLKGNLSFLPTVTDYEKLGRLNWRSEFTQSLFESICDHYIKVFKLNHLLIDLRTGFYPATSSGLYKSQQVVLVFRLDNQNLAGVKTIIDYCKQRGKPFILVASLIPETSQTAGYLQKFQDEFGETIKVRLPYDADLALAEKIVVLDYPQKCFTQEFQKLVGLIEGEE